MAERARMSAREATLRRRATAVCLMSFAAVTIAFALVAELVLHRWLHLHAHDITGSAWIFFGGFWSIVSWRSLAPATSITDRSAPQPLDKVIRAYGTSLPGVAIYVFVLLAVVGGVERLWAM